LRHDPVSDAAAAEKFAVPLIADRSLGKDQRLAAPDSGRSSD
jgi:hypothetical protein